MVYHNKTEYWGPYGEKEYSYPAIHDRGVAASDCKDVVSVVLNHIMGNHAVDRTSKTK